MRHMRIRRHVLVLSYLLLVFHFAFFALAPYVNAQTQGTGTQPQQEESATDELPAPGAVPASQIAEIPKQAGLVLSGEDPRIIVARIIRVALGFLGIVTVVLILYGGFLWMTSAGNEETIAKAKKVIINAVIGLAIILSALAITQFILRGLLAALGTPASPAPAPAPGRVGGGALGSGIIESHYPTRGATGVPRNTRIIITFKEPIDPESIAEVVPESSGAQIVTQVDGVYRYPTYEFDHDSNPATVPLPISALRLKRSSGIPSAILMMKTEDISGQVRDKGLGNPNGEKYLGSDDSNIDVLVSFTEDLRTFVLTPVERTNRSKRALFGSAEKDTSYTVYLCGTASSPGNCAAGGVKLLTGQPAFQGLFKDYSWSYEVGTFLDVTPPKISSVVPYPDNASDTDLVSGNCRGTSHGPPCDKPDRPRNAMVQVNFNEPVLPTVASGKTIIEGPTNDPPTRGTGIRAGSYDIMQVSIAGGTPEFIAGQWQLGNQYRTAEFISTDLCGRNSCGDDVFCLPELSNIRNDVMAASLLQPGDPSSAGLFDGIEDIAGNSFDGNKDGKAQGPATIYDLNNPSSVETPPGDNARFSFWTSDNVLLGSTLIESTTPETTYGQSTTSVPLVSPIEMTFDRAIAMTTLSSKTVAFSGTEERTGGVWDTWWTLEGENLPDTRPASEQYGRTLGRIIHGGLWEQTAYINEITSKVKDLYQNCYYPGSGSGIAPNNTMCVATDDLPYCCNGVACAPGDANCSECGF